MKRQLKHGDKITVTLTAVQLEFVEANSFDPKHQFGTNFGHFKLVKTLTEIAENDQMIVHPQGGQLANGGILVTNTDELDGDDRDRFFFVYSAQCCFLCDFKSDDSEVLQQHFDTVHR